MRTRDEGAETAGERIGSYPRFMRTSRVPAAGDDGGQYARGECPECL